MFSSFRAKGISCRCTSSLLLYRDGGFRSIKLTEVRVNDFTRMEEVGKRSEHAS